jgi:hypothetical protein
MAGLLLREAGRDNRMSAAKKACEWVKKDYERLGGVC